MKTRQLPDGSVLYSEGKTAMLSRDFGSGVVLHVCRGAIGEDYVKFITRDGDRQLREHGRCIFMVDSTESPRVTTEFREAIALWMKANEKATAHLLIRSKLVEMALMVVNLVLKKPQLRAYTNSSQWESLAKNEAPNFSGFSIPSDPSEETTRA